ncbi:helicase [Cyclophragma undans nucleopolyhedrovirus]|uniref:Helicase n=1 Tax=Cyclophragma undans nucleopolyhedrovirus TaxID=1906244 RepID=A0A288QZK1_9ABAC|nr:helicase [Cyclophragma undans nucleopolyhedrovirus]AOT85532.1 helicase [Cyclophragma undans nucleopolyhedrovirus]
MATNTIDTILQFLFKDVPQDKTYEINNLQDANTLIIKNARTGIRKLLEYTKNFTQLLNTLVDNFNGSCAKHHVAAAVDDDDDNDDDGQIKKSISSPPVLSGHDWELESNDFCIFVKPFLLKRHYETIKNYIDFSDFFAGNASEYINECVSAGEYCYWPNWPKKQAISFVGWRLYLYMKFGIDIEPTIPIIHNSRLGAVNLFVLEPDLFLSVELSLRTDADPQKVLFVNGKSKFDASNKDLFIMKMADGTFATCKVFDELVNSDKNFFDYIRDDINLEECITTPAYKHIINVNLKRLRTFEDATFSGGESGGSSSRNSSNNSCSSNCIEMINSKPLVIIPIISASSENADLIQGKISTALMKINESMVKVIAANDRADDPNVLKKYFEESRFKNFDYILFVVWKLLTKQDDFAYRETDIKLVFELLCESIFGSDKDALSVALDRCDPYLKLNKTIFNRICNHWYTFDDINPCVALGYYFGIHYLIYLKLSATNDTLDYEEAWAYTYENVIECDLPPEILCKGFFRKLENVVTGVNLVFNGKHYQVVKREDDLYKLSKGNCYKLSNVKFNNWKYLYLTTHGVYNVLTNSFHSSCPFLLGTTLPHPFKHPNDENYLPEEVFQYMLDTGAEEINLYRIYHIAKMCRDVKMVKTNLAIVSYLSSCNGCRSDIRVQLNNLFRDLWNLDDEDLVALALYLKRNTVSDILHNFKCNQCRSKIDDDDDGGAAAAAAAITKDVNRTKCKCFKRIKVNRQALKVCLIADLFGNDSELSELMWLLIFNTKPYLSAALMRTHSNFVGEHAEFFAKHHAKLIKYLHRLMHKIEYADTLMETLADKQTLILELRIGAMNEPDHEPDETNGISKFYVHYTNALTTLKKYNVWWDKIILAREKDDLSAWLTRFYMRIILSKMDLKNYSYNYIKKVVEGYLYFKRFTNFNHTNSMVMMHYAASLAIPVDYGKKAVYLPGEPGSGKSSFFELLDYLVLMHKFDDDNHSYESNRETSDKEVTKLNSQLYTINELKMCSETYFKKHADSSKSDSKSRKYQGLLKYEANYKMLIVNNNPLYVDDYDDGVQDRFLIVYTNHRFTESCKFDGSIYYHIKSRRFPLESLYYDALVTPVRLFLSHVLMYRRDAKNGFVPYKTLLNNDPVHKHNLLCLSTNNSPLYALIYILNIKTAKSTTATIGEDKMEEMIGAAVHHLKTFLHPSFAQYNAKKNINLNNTKSFAFNEQILLQQIKNKFKNNYNNTTNVFYNMTMALTRGEMNTDVPFFKC